MTPLMKIISAESPRSSHSLDATTRSTMREVLNMLLQEESVEVKNIDKKGSSALTYACEENVTNPDIIKALSRHKHVDVNASGANGHPALVTTCQRNHVETFRTLLAHPSIDVNETGTAGCPAFIMACKATVFIISPHSQKQHFNCKPKKKKSVVMRVAFQCSFTIPLSAI